MVRSFRIIFIAVFSLLVVVIGIDAATASDSTVFYKKPVLVLSGIAGDRPGEFGTVGKGDGMGPMDFLVDPDNNIWVMDVMNRRVQKFDRNGKFLLEYPNKNIKNSIELTSRYIECTHSGDIIIGPISDGEMVILNNNGEYQRTITLPDVRNEEFDFTVNNLNEIIYPRGKDSVVVDMNGKIVHVAKDQLGVGGDSSSPYTTKVVYDSGNSTQTIINSSLRDIGADSIIIKNDQLDTGVKDYAGKFILFVDPFNNLFVKTMVNQPNSEVVSYNDVNGRLIKALKKSEVHNGWGYKTYHIDKHGNLYAMEVVRPENAIKGKSLGYGENLLKGGKTFVYLWRWDR
ncbi:MAG TPA: hypothetical protein DGG95_17240 [Cytophagales bacterium]|jgi:hypothetical protein|nr:hypothetical protein [Cytophagales bacterium]